MKNFRLIPILLMLFCATASPAQSKRKSKAVKPPVVKSKIKKKVASPALTISCGVCNHKALNLVAPDYPLAAKAVSVRGAVRVSVLIDEAGKVVKAEAHWGHPLLRQSAVSAALKSKFEPTILSGKPVKVYGTIIYNFSLGFANWLEIGNAVGDSSFVKLLPAGFEEEKRMYEEYKAAGSEDKILISQKILLSIENKLSGNAKKLWLFRAGMLLNDFQAN